MHLVLTALKHYGMFVADNGTSWFLSGTADNRWNNDDLHALISIPGADFEVVDESMLEINPNSAQVAGSPSFPPSPTSPVSPAHSPTASAVGINSPHSALTPEVIQIDQSGLNDNNPNTYLSRQNGISSATGNRLPFILGAIVILLGITGVAVGMRSRKRFKPSGVARRL